MEKGIVRFDINEATIATIRGQIANMAKNYMPLEVKGLDDAEGLKQVHAARIDTKNLRVTITKGGKELREEANSFLKKELAVEKEILALIAPIEEHLQSEEDKIQTEKDRIKAEAAEKERARIQARIDRLEDLGMVLYKGQYILPFDPLVASWGSPESVAAVNDELFEKFIQEVITAVAAEKERLANIEAAQKAEEDRLAKVAAEQEAERVRLEEISRKNAEIVKKMEEDREKIEAEKKALADAKQKEVDDKRRAEELEKAKAEAAEKARIEAEAKAKRDAEEAERNRVFAIEQEHLKAVAAEEEVRRQEELRPDKEKLISLAEIIRALPMPALKNKQAKDIAEATKINLLMASKKIEEAVAKMKGGK